MIPALGCLAAVLIGVWCARELWQHWTGSWERMWDEIDGQRTERW